MFHPGGFGGPDYAQNKHNEREEGSVLKPILFIVPFVWLGPLLCGRPVAWSRMVCLAARIRRFDQGFHLLLGRSGNTQSPSSKRI